MRLVTFSRDLAPHGVGDTRLVPDDVAIELERDDAISSSKPWPDIESTSVPVKPVRPTLKPNRPSGQPDRRIAR